MDDAYRADHLMERQRRKRRLWLILAGGAGAVLAALVLAGVLGWAWAFHDLPDAPENADELWAVRREASVTLLDADGQVVAVRGPLYARTVRLAELPEHVPQAFLAIEDRRFYEHDGVDRRGLVRAMMRNLAAGRVVQGGSTLTMQLVKNLILTDERTMRRKLQEIRLAWAIEDRLSKTQILELYLNRIYLGARAYGLEAAAQRYFGKTSAELTLPEAALLAALPKAPSRLDPTTNLSAAQARAARVIEAMLEAEFITEVEAAEALANPAAPIEESGPGDDPDWGYVFDFALAELERLVADAPPDVVIQTTIDPDLLAEAQNAVNTVLEAEGEAASASQAALIALAPDGAVLAMAGGRDYRTSQYNRAVQAHRQPGSAFKPIVFAAALEAGRSPSSAYWDEPIDLEGWSPQNFSGGYQGLVTLQEALKRSINTVAAQIVDELGAEAIVEIGGRLGIRSELAAHRSIALGTLEVTLLELTGAYAVFANDGRRQTPFLVTQINDSRGGALYRRTAQPPPLALDQGQAREMSTMLQDVVMTGTGRAARLGERPAAGKTGTSQSFRDAWFVGFTADYIAGVWVGNDDDSPMDDVTGGGLPAQIWRRFMTAAHQGLPVSPLAGEAPRARSEEDERRAAFYSDLSASFSTLLSEAGGEASDEP